MAFRVNNDGYRIDMLGNILPTTEEDRQKFLQTIDAAWRRNNPGENPPSVPEEQTIMIVQDGDCQWTIAEAAGADPRTTAYQMNEQFANPDLIHRGDVVFVDATTQWGAGTSGVNVGLYGDKVYHDTNNVAMGPGPDYNQQFAGITGDIGAYIQSIPPEFRQATMEALILDYQWSPGDEGGHGRQLTIEAYLRSLPAGSNPEGTGRDDAIARMKLHATDAYPEGDPRRASLLADIDNAARSVAGL